MTKHWYMHFCFTNLSISKVQDTSKRFAMDPCSCGALGTEIQSKNADDHFALLNAVLAKNR